MMWVALLLLFPLSVQAEDLGELSANPFHRASTSNPSGVGIPSRPTVEGSRGQSGISVWCTSVCAGTKLDQERELYPSDHFVHLHGKIIEDCLATWLDPTLFNEFLKSFQISLDARRHHFQCLFYMFDDTLRGILYLQHDL